LSSGIEFPVEGISDGVVRLRLHADSDVPAIVAACQDPEIPRWTRVPEPYGEADARGWLEQESRGAERVGLRQPRRGPDRNPRGAGQRRLAAGRRASRIHVRRRASLLHREQGSAAWRGVVLPASRRATL